MTYIWKTYPGISHRDLNQPGSVLYLRPEKSGEQAEADAREMRWGEEFVIQTDQMPDILFDYYSNVSTGQILPKWGTKQLRYPVICQYKDSKKTLLWEKQNGFEMVHYPATL